MSAVVRKRTNLLRRSDCPLSAKSDRLIAANFHSMSGNNTRIHGTHEPIEEPSTASKWHQALSPLVMKLTAYRIMGAAKRTTGVIIAHEIIHDFTHWLANIGLLKNGALEIPAATAQVNPD
jgi:hypothetical protein